MIYITTKASPRYREMSLDDLWFGDDDRAYSGMIAANETNTVTRCVDAVSRKIHNRFSGLYQGTTSLHEFNHKYQSLFEADRRSLYRTFYVPKSSGGLRRIDAPNEELMVALRELKLIFETVFGARWLYHTSAFAYIHGRSTIGCVKKHQSNESKWFGKFDVHNFFGSTTIDFVMQMFEKVFPFSEIVRTTTGKQELETALSLCFLDGVLPQGTPISPLITNIMMIPIDYTLEKKFRDEHMIYTRYADDFLISSRQPFRFRDVECIITSTLHDLGAPFALNTQKTRYGSANGANWNFEIMLNKDNQMTVGRKKKKQFESMLVAYAKDKKSGVDWSLEDVQHLDGLRSYYKMVEGETIDRIIEHISGRQNVRIAECIKADLRR